MDGLDLSLLVGAINVFLKAAIPFFLAIVGAGLFVGAIQVSTQIEESGLSFVARFLAMIAVLYFGTNLVSAELIEFAKRYWIASDFYF